MWLYVLVFMISWIVFFILANKKQLHRLFVSGIFAALLASTIDSIRLHLHWWELSESISLLQTEQIANFGKYPIEAMLLVQYSSNKRWRWLYLTLAFSTLNTVLEYVLVYFGQLKYSNGWNSGLTFVSYVIPFSLVYWHSTIYKRFFI